MSAFLLLFPRTCFGVDCGEHFFLSPETIRSRMPAPLQVSPVFRLVFCLFGLGKLVELRVGKT